MGEWTDEVAAVAHRGLAPDAHRIVAKVIDEVCGLELRVGSALERRQEGTKLENELKPFSESAPYSLGAEDSLDEGEIRVTRRAGGQPLCRTNSLIKG
jgi:hypothetical protein